MIQKSRIKTVKTHKDFFDLSVHTIQPVIIGTTTTVSQIKITFVKSKGEMHYKNFPILFRHFLSNHLLQFIFSQR